MGPGRGQIHTLESPSAKRLEFALENHHVHEVNLGTQWAIFNSYVTNYQRVSVWVRAVGDRSRWISMQEFLQEVWGMMIGMLNAARLHTSVRFEWKNWLVVWLPFFIFPLILGFSSSQLTFIFFRGVAQPPTSDGESFLENWVFRH